MLPSFRRHGDLLFTYLGPQRTRVVILGTLLFSSIALQLANPQIVRFFIDTAQSGGPTGVLTTAAIAFLIVAVVQQFVALGATYLGEVVGWDATNRLRADLMRHCLGLDLPFYKSHTPGELIERIDGDVTLLANFFSQFTINILGNLLLVLGILLILTVTNFWLGLGLTLYALATFLALRALQRRAVGRFALDRQASADQYGAIEERLVATEDIRGVGAEAYVLSRTLGIMQRRLRTSRRAKLAGNASFFASNFLYVMAYAVGLALGAFLFERHQITLGTAYLIVFYIGMLAAPLDKIRLEIQDLQQASAGIGRVDSLLRAESQLLYRGAAILPTGPLQVCFANVSFSYEEGDGVLHDLSFSLDPGQSLGLLGRTGSGKTTITRLLARLYDPAAGEIRLNGVDLRDVSVEQLRHGVGMVTQDVQLFHASVRDNLTFFRSGIEDTDILNVFDQLDLGEWYRGLPGGLDTILGPGGAGLSAGEAQLVAFARVFLLDPGLVVLDEPTSRLDPATERRVERAIERLRAGRTAIIVAHRLRTVEKVDRVLVLEDGRILEEGYRKDLVHDSSSRFSALLRAGLEDVLA